MTGMLRVPRSRGALNGVLLVLLGIWGGLIAFVGPYFQYAYTPDKAFTYTTGRLWLEILPTAGTILGGLILGGTASRPVAIFGAWLAALSGGWFVLPATPPSPDPGRAAALRGGRRRARRPPLSFKARCGPS
jgi:hypothetical protein